MSNTILQSRPADIVIDYSASSGDRYVVKLWFLNSHTMTFLSELEIGDYGVHMTEVLVQ